MRLCSRTPRRFEDKLAVTARLGEKLIQKHREQGANSVTDADKRRWLLPDMQKALIKSFPARKPLKGIPGRLAISVDRQRLFSRRRH
jgi:hypothetical protein